MNNIFNTNIMCLLLFHLSQLIIESNKILIFGKLVWLKLMMNLRPKNDSKLVYCCT